MCNLQTISPIVWILIIINSSSAFSLQTTNSNVTDFIFKNLEACLTLAGIDDRNIIYRNSGNKYDDLNWQWNSLNGYIQPMAYLVANDVSDVQSAVICCKSLNVRIVAKSGGHSYTKSGFGDYHSMIVDLAKLNRISLHPKRMNCEIEPGARAGLIIYTLWNEGKFMIPVGICPTVGIAGLALGGGFGYFARQFGHTSDNLIELEMVNADGDLMIINNYTNKDLFWALRGGGGGSYGIVTKLKFKLYPIPESIVFGIYEYSFDDFALFYQAWQSLITFHSLPNSIGPYVEMSENKISMQIFNVNVQNTKNGKLSVADVENLLRSFSFPSSIKSSIELLSYHRFMVSRAQYYSKTLLTHISQLTKITKHRYVGWKKVKSLYVYKTLEKMEICKLQVLLSSYLKAATLHFEHNGGAINKLSRSDTAFIHRGNLFCIQLQAFSAEGEELNWKADSAMKTFYEESKSIWNHRESYQNYLDQDIPDYLDRYYGANLKKLVEVKMRVDPENVFHHPQSIPVTFY